MLGPEGIAQQRIVKKIDLPDRNVVRDPPVEVREIELLRSLLLRCVCFSSFIESLPEVGHSVQ